MKTNLAIALGVGLLCASAVNAQTETTGARQGGAARGPITVTGCLQTGTSGSMAGSTTSTGTATTSGSSGFMLTNVKMTGSSLSTSTTAGTTGGTSAGSTTGGSMAATMPSSFALQAEDAQLRPHVGHQIEVTGTVGGGRGMNNAGSTAAGTTAGTGTSTTSEPTTSTTAGETASGRGMRGAGGMRTLRVESVKMIAASCSEK